jgi:membrane protein required for colicin V production
MAWQLASLASVFLSGVVAIAGCAALTPYFNVREPWDRVFAMLLLYVATAAVIWIGFRCVSKLIVRIHMKDFDRQLGGMFGLAKGVLYCILITFFAVTLSESARQVILTSRSGDFIARAIHHANPILPADVRAVVGKYINELDERLHAPPAQSQRPLDALPSVMGLDKPASAATGQPTSATKGGDTPAAATTGAGGAGK